VLLNNPIQNQSKFIALVGQIQMHSNTVKYWGCIFSIPAFPPTVAARYYTACLFGSIQKDFISSYRNFLFSRYTNISSGDLEEKFSLFI